MGVTVRHSKAKDANGNNLYHVSGGPAISKVGIFFGIMFLIFGVIALLGGSLLSGFVLLPIANIILFASNRHTKSVRQKKINEFAAREKGECREDWR